MGKDKRKLVVSCVPCNKRVELPIDSAVLTFHIGGEKSGQILLNDLVQFSNIQCKDCLGAADVEVIQGD